MDDKITQLDRFLSRIQLLDPPYRESKEGRQVFQDTCKLVFEEQLYSHLSSEPTAVEEVASVAESILALEPKDTATKWRIVHQVLKTAKSRKKWNIVSHWIEKVNPDELSTAPMKDDRGRDGWCEQAIWYNFRARSGIEVEGEKRGRESLAGSTNR